MISKCENYEEKKSLSEIELREEYHKKICYKHRNIALGFIVITMFSFFVFFYLFCIQAHKLNEDAIQSIKINQSNVLNIDIRLTKVEKKIDDIDIKIEKSYQLLKAMQSFIDAHQKSSSPKN